MSWSVDIDNTIFSIIQFRGENLLEEEYPNIFFTQTDQNESTPIYPTVYIHKIGGSEYTDLDGATVCGINSYTLQIEIYTNTSQNDARVVASGMVDVLKTLRFTVSQMPIFDNENGIFRMVMRARRNIGAGDDLTQ